MKYTKGYSLDRALQEKEDAQDLYNSSEALMRDLDSFRCTLNNALHDLETLVEKADNLRWHCSNKLVDATVLHNKVVLLEEAELLLKGAENE